MKYVIEYWSDWSDYARWEPADHLDDGSGGHVFDTAGEASAQLAALKADAEQHHAKRVAQWQAGETARQTVRDLYEARKALLVGAGLWKQDDERMSPLVRWYVEPMPRFQGTEFRVAEYSDEQWADS